MSKIKKISHKNNMSHPITIRIGTGMYGTQNITQYTPACVPKLSFSMFSTNDAGQKVTFAGAGGAAQELRRQLQDTGCQSVVLVRSKSSRFQEVADEALGGLEVIDCNIAVQHVPSEIVEEARKRTQQAMSSKAPCVIVALGGGSVIGLAKAVVATIEEDLSLIAVPSSYSGSELTNIYGVTVDLEGKIVKRDDRARPSVTIYDPKLSGTLPREYAITSAWNACAHAIGALTCSGVSPLVHRKAEDGLKSIVDGFRLMLKESSESDLLSEDAVSKMQYGAYLCGSVLNECSMGIHHKVAHILGGSFSMEHSKTHTALLPFTVQFNLSFAPVMGKILGDIFRDSSNPAGAIWDLQKKLGAPTNIRTLGFSFENIEKISHAVEEHAQRTSYSNPRPVVASDVAEMLNAAHHGRRPSLPRVTLDRANIASGMSNNPHATLPIAMSGASLESAKMAIICVHGRFASAERIIQMFEEQVAGKFYASGQVSLLAPQALNSNWYPGSFLKSQEDNQPNYGHTMTLIDRCVRYAADHVGGPQNVFLFGFSQGACAAVSYATSAMAPQKMGGIIAMSGGLCGTKEECMDGRYDTPAMKGVPCILGCAEDDAHVPAARVKLTADILTRNGAQVHMQLYPGSKHRIYEASASRARSLVTSALASRQSVSSPQDPYTYLNGFKAQLMSEAIPNTVPRNQRSPRFVAHGLIAECISGSPFCAPRGENLVTWFYRIHASVHTHGSFQHMEQKTLVGDFCCPGGSFTPEPVRWFTPPNPKESETKRDFVESLVTLAGTGNPMSVKGLAIHTYACNKDMVDRSFYDSDGDLLIVPELGTLEVQTEFGFLRVAPGEVMVLPRGLKMTVTLPEGQSRGFVGELFESTHFSLPNLGPLGSNGLAAARHFQVPTAAYEDRACSGYELVSKFGGDLFVASLEYSPYDVVGWSGNYHPAKYNLLQFMAFGSVTWDHADPSINTVLTCPVIAQNSASAFDFVCFRPRWDAVTHTWRPPYWHRNIASEFNAIIKISQPYSGFAQGVHWLTPCMTAHGISAASHTGFDGAPPDDDPKFISSDSIWIMFETVYPLILTEAAASAPHRDTNYREFFAGVPRKFSPPKE